ncbi:MAG TPA: type II CRISPR RNA-guided endonuclease Cas9 [Terriglobia bacterium]|nr:type II CRISPR RNA-guided endonuclease Cas9 [Terriglobia bacterium]
MDSPTDHAYILGIDLGSTSAGWAVVRLIDGEPAGLLRAGVRIFEAGMEGNIESGREESRNATRREARLHRRQLWRRRRRLTKVFNLLQHFGLLPPIAPPFRAAGVEGEDAGLKPGATSGARRAPLQKVQQTADRRQDFLNQLDQTILASTWFAEKQKSVALKEPMQIMPYLLRAAALDERLDPHFLGRALYHLAQRRGFLSNRKSSTSNDKKKDEGPVKEGISELRAKMQESQARTLGEYFAHLKPSEQRIRGRYTHRSMYEEEFALIWEAQRTDHPDLLTEERRKQLKNALFFQRPLKIPRSLVGDCELEAGSKRAPRYLPVAQRFRMLQTVNNLKVLPPDEAERDLTREDWTKLTQALEEQGDRTFAQIRKLLDLPKTYSFNLERGGEKRVPGNRTNAAFAKVFGARWREFTDAQRQEALQDVLSIQKPEVLKRRGMHRWGLSEDAASAFAEITLEPDYLSLSRRAMERVLPLLEQGMTYAEARKQVYPEVFKPREPAPLLPAVSEFKEIRNPAVIRSLTELRKVVNALIRQYGKPQGITIELARDLRNTKKQREGMSKRMKDQEDLRKKMAERIMAEAGIPQPVRRDIEKALLWDECKGVCPYTGRSIPFRALFGDAPQFDVEHIIPFSRSLDDAFSNKTLCAVDENRNVKTNKTPFEAYGQDEGRFEAMLDRVRRFNGGRELVAAKLKRFQLQGEDLEIYLAEFKDRYLNDTRYASKLAADYMALLYGGRVDEEHERRIHTCTGQVTAYLRSLWGLNAILNDGPSAQGGAVPKSRADHRHHAVDAVAIALTNARMIQRLSLAAEHAPLARRRRFAPLEGPWPDFVESVRAEIDHIVVSHRVSRKVSGALHEETIYSPPKPVAPVYDRREKANGEGRRSQSGATDVRVRKPLDKLTKPEIEKIVDAGVRKLVEAKLAELGGDPKKFPPPDEHENLDRFPCFVTKDGRRIAIKRVRINKAVPVIRLGEGRAARHVASESNHHVEIYAELDKNGDEDKWDGEVVPMYEAYQRLKAGKPVVQRDHGPLVRFKFSLAPGEIVECDIEDGKRGLWVVRGMTSEKGSPRLFLVRVRDARKKSDITKSGLYWRPFLNPLRALRPRKVAVSPLGEVTEAHD